MDERKKFLWEQIRDDIRAEILTGKIKGGERLPSVRELMEKYDVSMPVAKRAYTSLEQSGLVYSIKSKGMYASANALNDEMKRIDQLVTEQCGFDKVDKETAAGISKRLNSLYYKMIKDNFNTLDVIAVKMSENLFKRIADKLNGGTDIEKYLHETEQEE